MRIKRESNLDIKVSMNIFVLIISMLFILYGCGGEEPAAPKKAPKKQPVKASAKAAAQLQVTSEIYDADVQKGYIYERRDRRDPFIPLIQAVKKTDKQVVLKPGTLEGYDIGAFSLSAIAKKGTQYFALLVSPDNRSFTVYKGTKIGLSKGTVESITNDRVKIVEYSKDYTGKLKPREIILEFNKGEIK